VTVKGLSSRLVENVSKSYIDYDEIDSLLKGIEYIAKIDKTTTRLIDFQADYRTKADLVVSTYSSGKSGEIGAGVKNGLFGGTALLSLPELEQFRKLIAKSKEMLDAIRK